jgi:NTE family protein
VDHFRIKLLFILLFLFVAKSVWSQQGTAVVLSGGGSRGMAHIGVLKALEENDVPIDYIAGTSIGAAVGAMYAAGFSPQEIEDIFTSEDFRRWIAGDINRSYSWYYTSDLPDAGWVDLNLEFNNRFSKVLPSGIKTPVELDFQITRLLADASAVAGYDFDNLMIPFRCVAADIDSSQAIVLRHGDLARSVRASITFPFLYTPIKIDDRLLFDGGMYNNFPTDVVANDFDPALIIGSKVSGNFPKPQAEDVLSQIQNMLMSDTDFALDSAAGIVLEPNLPKVNLTDFSLSKAFIQAGYDMAIQNMPLIKARISEQRTAQQVASLRQRFNARKQPYLIDSIYISGLKPSETEYVYRTLTHRKNNSTLDEISGQYFKLAADDKLKLDGNRMVLNPTTGLYNLFLDLRPAKPLTLTLGGNISTRTANLAFAEINYRYLFREALRLKFNVYFGRFYTSALAGARLDFPGKIPLYAGGLVVYNHFDYFKSTIHFIEDVTPSYLIQNENFLDIYAGMPLTVNGRLEADVALGRLENEYYQTNAFTRTDTADKTRFDYVQSGLCWELNSLNRKQYASAGARFSISTGMVWGNENFESGSAPNIQPTHTGKFHHWAFIDLLWDNYFQKFGPVKLGFYSRIHLSNQDFFGNYTSSLLVAPAFEPVPESKAMFLLQYRAYNYGAAGLKAVWSATRNIDLRSEAYLFQPYQSIKKDADNLAYFGQPFDDRYWMFSGAVVYHTIIGPVSLSINYFDNPEEKFFVGLNIGYIIFNKSIIR